MRKSIVLGLLTTLLAACGVVSPGRQAIPGPMMNPGGRGWRNTRFSSNGEQIYFTATNVKGERISYTDGPLPGGMMMGNSALTCASCHGPDGGGGIHSMHMAVMDAPDIRYDALSAESGEHAHEEEGHDDLGEYDLETFRQAVVEGEHPNGEALNRDMPRWQIEEEDLADLFDFLKTLP